MIAILLAAVLMAAAGCVRAQEESQGVAQEPTGSSAAPSTVPTEPGSNPPATADALTPTSTAANDFPTPGSTATNAPIPTTTAVPASSSEGLGFDVDTNIAFEKFQLANGLEVVMHVDRSDPVVAVALTAHVGSAREKAGRTGPAHMFEHPLFLESENLGKGGLDKMSARIGRSGANGSTSRDRTN